MDKNLILVIDDEPIQQQVVEDYLTAAGYRVVLADSGDNGLRMMRKQRPDLILLDIIMPGMDGFETLDIIRKRGEFRDIPVLFLTSIEQHLEKVKGLELGADDYITKPFHREELIARIKAVLRRTGMVRKKSVDMEGDLSTLKLIDLLQSMDLGTKTGIISMEELDAKIFLENGTVAHVRKSDLQGIDALTRLFLLEKGSFFVKFGDVPEKVPRDPISFRALLAAVLANLELAMDAQILDAPNRPNVISDIKLKLQQTERLQKTEGMMEGDLSDVGLSDLLQSLELGLKTAGIYLKDMDAEIYIQDGQLILARQGNFSGDQALIRIFLLEKGAFSVQFDELPAKISGPPEPLTSVLMRVLNEVDEIKDVVAKIKAENRQVRVTGDVSAFPSLQPFKDLNGIPFIDLIVRMSGEIRGNMRILIAASKKGNLKLIR